MRSMFIYMISGRGRKSGVANATAATPSLVPLIINLNSKYYLYSEFQIYGILKKEIKVW